MVSADHGHVFTIGAYGERGTSVFGTGERSSYRHRWSRNGTDEENTFILGYANGPGYRSRYVQNPDNETEWRCGRELPSDNENERNRLANTFSSDQYYISFGKTHLQIGKKIKRTRKAPGVTLACNSSSQF